MANCRLMQVKSIAECSTGEHSAILLTFIKLSFVIKIFVLSIFSGRFSQVLLYYSLPGIIQYLVSTAPVQLGYLLANNSIIQKHCHLGLVHIHVVTMKNPLGRNQKSDFIITYTSKDDFQPTKEHKKKCLFT